MPRKSPSKRSSPRNRSTKPKGKVSGDFGVSARDRRVANDVSQKTRHRTRSKAGGDSGRSDLQPRAGSDSREAGVGGREAGPGSYSGGDIDTDFTGISAGGP